ncbi:ABC transporter ATP-binding protein [Paracraurococcus lichenis]|uniref:ABC transporter ATP-binding protein n=1 Tax=Paracraurococcus lichenis TaxID=3064888 RepID=A0ABT9E5K5_9PROT|nr:ABC transporter ATP-binding protein [Paracraurococcus sp. LOR1-02]MDO9711456.1 ABC transporter ATP-binding protein [Paracraurococcus sp. LOR1-02]
MSQVPILEVQDLTVRFGALTAVDRLSFALAARETLAIVGESGCGKSVSAMAILRLLPATARLGGRVLFRGQDLVRLDETELAGLRSRGAAMIFQDPLSALNPVMRVGEQIAEVVRRHDGASRAAARRRALELLAQVRITDPERRLDDYPHRLSGGMRQRVMIAMALAARPALLIADEATTALDVTIQAQILKLLWSLQQELGMALILISHDLAVVAEMADRVLVMYAGRKIEEQPADSFFQRPLHPYSRGLLRARPVAGHWQEDLAEIPGVVPALDALPAGCAFAPRCAEAIAACHAEAPPLARHGAGFAACIRIPQLALQEAT